MVVVVVVMLSANINSLTTHRPRTASRILPSSIPRMDLPSEPGVRVICCLPSVALLLHAHPQLLAATSRAALSTHAVTLGKEVVMVDVAVAVVVGAERAWLRRTRRSLTSPPHVLRFGLPWSHRTHTTRFESHEPHDVIVQLHCLYSWCSRIVFGVLWLFCNAFLYREHHTGM